MTSEVIVPFTIDLELDQLRVEEELVTRIIDRAVEWMRETVEDCFVDAAIKRGVRLGEDQVRVAFRECRAPRIWEFDVHLNAEHHVLRGRTEELLVQARDLCAEYVTDYEERRR